MSTLENLASEFVECADGAEAVAAFARESPDWTIMDLAMEPMDGLEATSRIKAQFTNARIVIVTQHDSPPMRQAAGQAGALAFVPKENLSELFAILRPQSKGPPSAST